MEINRDNFTILMADDDEEEFFLFKEGLKESHFDCNLCWVPDGKELMCYLLQQGKYICPEQSPRPLFILLDLNMPGPHGIDILMEMKSLPELKHTPVIIYTSSRNEENVRQCYTLGANGYILKPDRYDQLINIIINLFTYWTRTVRLPKVEFITSPKKADYQGAENRQAAM